jgi:phospholipid/cholesterol/gamma-HCH transport system substrate-binding protein
MTGRSSSRVTLAWQRLRSVPGLGRDILVTAVVIGIAVVVGGYLLGHVRTNWPWEREFVLKAEFAAVPGIAPGKGQEVRIAGVTVGDITSADATNHGTAILTMAVKPGNVIFDNARAVLRPKSPLNEMYVTIAPGGPPGKPLAAGGAIPLEQTTQPVSVDEVLSHLDQHTREAMTTLLSESDAALAGAPTNLPPGLRALDNTLVNLRPVAQSLQTRTAAIRTLSSALSHIATAVGGNDVRLASIANSLQATLGVIARNDDNLSAALHQLPDLTSQLDAASVGVRDLSTQLDPTLSNLKAASDGLPNALNRLNGTVEHLDSTLDSAGPFLSDARPVVGDMRPLVSDVNDALDDLNPTFDRLSPITSGVIPYLPDLKAFMAETASATSLKDANGGFFRARITVAPETVPFLPKSLRQHPPTPGTEPKEPPR